jgi:thiosulfate/3-mercaptopyruvate sulfurtransferase
MPHTTLVSTATLAAHLDDPSWAIVDCRFDLRQPHTGREAYRAAHIPGAVYAHLDEDLSTAHLPGRSGRHPLPRPDAAAATFARWGIEPGVQVVAYDDAGGMYAGRLWWMLRWLGHDAVALLDGDWRAWQREGRPVRPGEEQRRPGRFVAAPHPALVAGAEEVAGLLGAPGQRLLDARAFERYQGLNETLDPVAGHIPGALSAPFGDNLEPSGAWKQADALRARFETLLAGAPPESVVVYCGSGVSAAHLLLAMEHAGLPGARLYPGSWSEWVTDPSRPVATGEAP